MKKKILVVDGNSIVNRAFYGVRPLTTATGKNTNAVYGTVNIISKHLGKLSPDYAAVAFDLKAPTFRHKMYADYKAGRRPTPPELLEQFPEVKEILSCMGFHILELPGYEADDIQGTVAKMAHGADNTESYILSGDRDLLQLIDDKVSVILEQNTGAVIMHEEEFREKYGVSVSQFVDMKAIMGDSSDNIPGVRGIGERGAAALLTDFGTLDGIYEHIDDPKISKATRTKLTEHKDEAYLSRKLAQIDTHVPLGITLEDLRYRGIDRGGLRAKLDELELNSFIAKFGLTDVKPTPKTAHAPAYNEKVAGEGDGDNGNKATVASEESAAGCKEKITNSVVGNTESVADSAESGATRGAENDATGGAENGATGGAENGTLDSEVFEPADAERIIENAGARFSFSLRDGNVFICNGERSFSYTGDLLPLSPLFSGERQIVCLDGKAIYHALRHAGIAVSDGTRFLDLVIYAYVLNPGAGNATISSLAMSFLGHGVDPSEPCTAVMLRLEEVLRKKITDDGELRVLDEMEIPLINVLGDIEETGFKVDCAGLHEFADALTELADDLKNKIYLQAGYDFNLNSPKQLGEALFVKLGIPYPSKKKTASGYSTDADILDALAPAYPIIGDILEYRQVTKLANTYARVLPEVADKNGRIHTDFKQALTATGRLSSADPNLQNIPIRTRMGREMRRYFIADEGKLLLDADYSQIELRLLAHISGDYTMSEAFRSGEDIHRKTAAAVFGVPEEAVTEEMRKRAKAVNFGIVYGISAFSLAKDIGATQSEAAKYIKSYLLNYLSIDSYLHDVVEEAKKNGYTTTLFGRRRYIPELSSPKHPIREFGKRVAMNAPIQGTAADIMKLAMISVYRGLRRCGLDARIVMQVHDELVVECSVSDAPRAREILKTEMENVVKLSIPLTADVTEGKNWLEQS